MRMSSHSGNESSTATHCLQAFNELKTNPAKMVQFNMMIASYIDYHKQFCPGPIRQIKKLQIDK